MKLCFIDWFAYSLFRPESKIVFGGAQVQLYFLAKELAKDKQGSVSFLTDNRNCNRVETVQGIKVYQFSRQPQFFGSGQLALRLLRQLRQINAAVYVQRAASAETGLLAVLVKLLGKKFIYMVAHEQDVNGRFIRQNGWRGKWFWLGLTLANKIICQTKDQQQQLPPKWRIKSAILAPAFPVSLKTHFKLGIKQGILWVARAEEWKNPQLALTVAAKFPQEQFIMICPPAENNPRYFRKINAKAKALPNIRFAAWVPFQQIDAYFRRAKIFLSTSDSEGFPNTFIQAAKNRTPIVSFQVDPDRILANNQIGLCAGGDQRKLLNAIKRLLTNKKLWLTLSENAYRYAASRHQLPEAAVKFKSICLNLTT